ncbi:MAG TPA: hypothetical protein VLD61_02325 [Methylomirabilota bacterium]|nr:hypothetical protein [Methylomirabilota bacterium]
MVDAPRRPASWDLACLPAEIDNQEACTCQTQNIITDAAIQAGTRRPGHRSHGVTEPHAVRRLLAALGLAAEPPPAPVFPAA